MADARPYIPEYVYVVSSGAYEERNIDSIHATLEMALRSDALRVCIVGNHDLRHHTFEPPSVVLESWECNNDAVDIERIALQV